MPYALVTGSSRGLGADIARELASRGFNLLLVALPDEDLNSFTTTLADKYGIICKYFETDFTRPESVYDVALWAGKQGKVTILINNAGIGGTRAFDDASPEYIDSIIQTNIRTTSLLTRLMLPELKKNERAYILNISSMASFTPVAYKTVYPASKAFIWSFSRGLYEELRGTPVFVSVIHPGPMKTNSDVTRRIEKQGFFGQMGLIPTAKIARIAVTGLLNNDSLMIPGMVNKLNWVLMKILPVWLRLSLLSAVIKRELHDEPGVPSNLNIKVS